MKHTDLYIKKSKVKKTNKKQFKTFAPKHEWKNQTGNRRFRVRADDIILVVFSLVILKEQVIRVSDG